MHFLLFFGLFEPQRVQQDKDGRGRHRRRGDRGIDETAGRRRNADQIVDQRPAQVFADDPHRRAREPQRRRHRFDPPAEEHDVRRVNGDVRAVPMEKF